MKALVVLTQPPLLQGGAPGKCAVALLRGLRAHGVEVSALAARQTFAVPGEPPADLPVEVITVTPEPPSWRAQINRVRRPRGELARGELGERVREAARGVDVVHLEETETGWCDEGIATPSLVHLHYLVRRDRPITPPWTADFRDAGELALAEHAAIRRHRWLLASSPLVADALRRATREAEVVVAPLSLDPEDYPPAPLDGPPALGIIGTAAWPPTRGALRRLVERVWPEIRREVPDARLLVAGRGTDALAWLGDRPGVEVLGMVPSSIEFLHRLSGLVFPLQRGSGMKVKVLESIACGLPVVATPAGAEGIEAGDGVVVETDDRALAAAAADLLRDEAARRQRGAAGSAAFLARYAPVPATLPIVELYMRMASGDQAPT